QKSLLVGGSHFHVVDAFYVREIGTQAGVGQRPVLPDGLLLDRAQVGERIVAGVVVVLVAPDKTAEREYRIWVERTGPGRSDVEGLDLRSLVGRADGIAILVGDVQVIERVRSLKPGTGEAQIYVNGIRR